MNQLWALLDVSIGLILVYLLMSLMCSLLQELIANVMSSRGKHLKANIKAMLNDPLMSGLAKRLYASPRIKALSLPGKLPSYIPSAAFAKALADIIVEDGNLNLQVSGPLAPFIRAAAGQVDKLETDLAGWFDDATARWSGWYKRNVQLVLFALGLTLAGALNVSTIEIANVLWTQPSVRDAVVQSAQHFADTHNSPPDKQSFQAVEDQLNALALPVGWTDDVVCRLFGQPRNPPPAANGQPTACKPPADAAHLWRHRAWIWVTFIAGWLMTAFAVSLGTQFWFTTLGEALQLRAAGKKPPPKAHPSNKDQSNKDQ